MNDVGDLMYTPEAAAARYFFYQGQNEINLFVEDEGKEYEYETIFKRLLGDSYHISTIFSLCGKINIKKRFEEFGDKHNGVMNFYIVDGDFDRYIHANEMIHHSCFLYLETYNIENYFLDEKACIQFMKHRLKCLDSTVATKISFRDWKNKIVEQASKLFFCYCFMQKYHPSHKTIDRSPYCFIDKDNGFERIDGAYQHYWETEVQPMNSASEKMISDIRARYEEIHGCDYSYLICGKFLFISLYCHLRNIAKSSFNQADFRWHLINCFDIEKLSYVRDAISSLVTA